MEYSGTLSSIVHIIANGEPIKFLIINLRITDSEAKKPAILVKIINVI